MRDLERKPVKAGYSGDPWCLTLRKLGVVIVVDWMLGVCEVLEFG
jgi:hypothetical protein